MKHYSYHISGCAPSLYPTETYFGLLTLADGTSAEIPQQYPFSAEWGSFLTENVSLRESKPVPTALEIAYLSIVENKFYGLSLPIIQSIMEKVFENTASEAEVFNMVIGMAPYGQIALWLGSRNKQILLGWIDSASIEVEMEDFLPQQPKLSLKDYCISFINDDANVSKNLEKNGLPPCQLFDNYMKQYSYRYQLMFEHWYAEKKEWRRYVDEEEMEMSSNLDFIEEALFDGTHDKLHDGGLMNYHQAGKPKKLAVKWHIKKSEYTAYFWFEDEEIREVFDRFYGAHPDTKTDFMIRIDSEKNKYELALYRYGLKEPQVISESAYQLLVFKNKFEYYRSENYNQPRGAWIW